MPAYVIIEIKVHDPAKFEEYKKKAPPSIAAYDGKYLVRGGSCRNTRWHVGSGTSCRRGVPIDGSRAGMVQLRKVCGSNQTSACVRNIAVHFG